MTKKLTIEQVRAGFEERGWKLTATEYIKNVLPLAAFCPEGHETTISWNNLKAGQGCRQCAGNEKYTFEQVEGFFQERGCELLDTEYHNFLTPLRYRCKCGNISKIRLCDFVAGSTCWDCRSKKISDTSRTSEEEIADFCEEHNCLLIDSFIEKKRVRIQYICKCGKPSEAYWTNFQRCPNCRECGKAKKSGANCYRWNPDREEVASRKYWRKACGRIVCRCLKKAGTKKEDLTANLLGYTPAQLRQHIESHPDYPGPGEEFHIDHIFPVQAFIDHGIYDLRIINALDNLRPLPGPENLSKAWKYDKKKFQIWLDKHDKGN